MLPRVEGVSCGGDAQLSAQNIPLLYPGLYPALYHVCYALVAFSVWAQGLARSHWEGNDELPLKGAAFISGCRALPQCSMILACLRELLKEQDVWLGKLFYFHHSAERC